MTFDQAWTRASAITGTALTLLLLGIGVFIGRLA